VWSSKNSGEDGERHGDVDARLRIETIEPRPGDADDFDGASIDGDCAANGTRVPAERTRPIGVADDGYRGARQIAVRLRREAASQRDRHTKDRVIVTTDELPGHRFDRVGADHAERAGQIRGDAGKRIDRPVPFVEGVVRGGGQPRVMGEVEQLVRIANRHRREEHGIDETEQRRVGANAEGERHDDRRRHNRRLGHRSDGVAEVLAEFVCEPQTSLLAAVLLH
jgi:hypothetical protein